MTPPLEFFVGLESEVWEALVAGDGDADRSMLSADFLGVYPTGFAGRDEHVGQLSGGPTAVSYEIRDARLRVVTADHVLLSYRAQWQRTSASSPEVMYISSLWSLTDGSWINVFSQDTPAA